MPNLSATDLDCVGRDGETGRILELFDGESDLVTIVGPPGVGKTTVARHVVEQTRDGLDGTWFCGLRDAETDNDIVARLANVLPLQIDANIDPEDGLEQLAEWLEERSLLVVFDNVEHILGPVADVVERLLEVEADLRFLATSLQALGMPREFVFQLSPLSTDEAVELYVRRAERAGATTPDRSQIESLVEKLDKMPLAIELAAAQLPALGPAEVLDRMDRPFDILQTRADGGGWESPIRNAVAWSWSLLNAWERATLEQCSLFRGAFTLEAAEAVVSLEDFDGAPPIPQAVNRLVSKSLVELNRGTSGTRYFSLYVSVAEFTRSEMSDSEKELRDRHLAYLADRAGTLLDACYTGGIDSAIEEFEASFGDMVEAFNHGLDHDPVTSANLAATLHQIALMGAPLRDTGSLLERALCRLDDIDSDEEGHRLAKANLLQARSRAWYYAAAPLTEEVGRNYERALELIDEDDAPLLFADIQAAYAFFVLAVGRPDEARPMLQEALTIARSHGHDRGEFYALNNLSGEAFVRGDIETARRRLDEAIAIARNGDYLWLEGQGLSNLTIYEASAGDFERAAGYAQRLYDISGDNAHTIGAAVATETLGRFRLALGQFDAAERVLKQGLEKTQKLSHLKHRANYLSDLGTIALLRGEYRSASTRLDRAVGLARRAKKPTAEAEALTRLAAVAFLKGNLADGESRLQTARELGEQTGRPRILQLTDVMARFHKLGDALRAVESGEAERAEELLQDAGTPVDFDRRESDEDGSIATNMHARIAARIVQFATDRLRTDYAPLANAGTDNRDALRIGPQAKWFELPDEDRVDLSRRSAIRRILLALAEAREAESENALGVFDLIDAGWPDETLTPESGKSRVYTSVRTLRHLGLEDVLLTNDEGYYLDCPVALRGGGDH